MATIIKVDFGDGSARRCDARCHDAKGHSCRCVCGGRNHGVGEPQAHRNTMADSAAIRARIANTPGAQMKLFL